GESRHTFEPYPHRLCRDFCGLQHVFLCALAIITRMPKERDPTDSGHCLHEQLQTLTDELWGEERQSRDVATRPRQSGDKATRNRIYCPREDDGDNPGRSLGGQRGGRVRNDDDVDVKRHQIGCQSREPIVFPLGIEVLNVDVVAFLITEVAQPSEERRCKVGHGGQVASQVAYSRDLGRLLRACRERPCCRSSSDGDELASPHRLPQPEGHILPYRCRESRVVHHSKIGLPMTAMGSLAPNRLARDAGGMVFSLLPRCQGLRGSQK